MRYDVTSSHEGSASANAKHARAHIIQGAKPLFDSGMGSRVCVMEKRESCARMVSRSRVCQLAMPLAIARAASAGARLRLFMCARETREKVESLIFLTTMARRWYDINSSQ